MGIGATMAMAATAGVVSDSTPAKADKAPIKWRMQTYALSLIHISEPTRP